MQEDRAYHHIAKQVQKLQDRREFMRTMMRGTFDAGETDSFEKRT